jgi:hypothetical protein
MKKPIITALLSLFILSGCQNPSFEPNSTEGKEFCRYWTEDIQEEYEKEIKEWQNKIDSIQNETNNNSLIFKKGTVEYERYNNKKYGYIIEVPKSWGSLEYIEFGGQYQFSDELHDNMQFIGPYLSSSNGNKNEYIQIKILLNEDIPKEYESSFDYYESEFLDDKYYTSTESIDGNGNIVKIYSEFIPNSNSENFDCFKKHSLDGLENKLCPSLKYGLITNTDGEYYVRTYKSIQNDKGLYIFSYYQENNIQNYIVRSIELN